MYVFPMQEFQGSPETALTSPLQKSVSIIYEAFYFPCHTPMKKMSNKLWM